MQTSFVPSEVGNLSLFLIFAAMFYSNRAIFGEILRAIHYLSVSLEMVSAATWRMWQFLSVKSEQVGIYLIKLLLDVAPLLSNVERNRQQHPLCILPLHTPAHINAMSVWVASSAPLAVSQRLSCEQRRNPVEICARRPGGCGCEGDRREREEAAERGRKMMTPQR